MGHTITLTKNQLSPWWLVCFTFIADLKKKLNLCCEIKHSKKQFVIFEKDIDMHLM